MSNFLKLVISISIPLAIGATSGFFTVTGAESWYQGINKPSWNPPNRIFGPVWTTLYIMMGISFFLIWKADTSRETKKMAMVFFTAQLVLNFFWSFIFFNQQQPGWALVELAALWLMILATIFAFGNISKTAAWLLAPYISWVSFASILNYTIWQMNR
ncbi:MAG: tryptophan-rich sensory protein [Bacteroidetes bacterium]|nr:tryptophan-rich sensory protein [Bacteroidota bacterium]